MSKRMRIAFMVLNLSALLALVGWEMLGMLTADLDVRMRLTTLDRAGCFDAEKLKEFGDGRLADPRSREMADYIAGPRKDHSDVIVFGGAALTITNVIMVLIASRRQSRSAPLEDEEQGE